jgi:hypothetical protein
MMTQITMRHAHSTGQARTLLNKAKFIGWVCIESSLGASIKPGLLKLGTKIKNNIQF